MTETVETRPAPFTEQAVLLGEDRALVGIATRPRAPRDKPAVVILNTGIIHRVGHHRSYVTLSRRLASRGHPVVRFDFAGVGDSPPMTTEQHPLDANLKAIGEVLDWVETSLGARRVVLMGLCSGADHAALYAGGDPRVKGAVLIDPSIPRTFRFRLNDARRRLLRRKPWVNLLTGRGRSWARVRRALVGDTAPPPPPADDVQFSRANLEHPEAVAYLQRAYQAAVDGCDSLLAVFTGGPWFAHNYRTQILDALPKVNFRDRLELHYRAECDHTFTYEADRERLFADIEEWLDRHFPDAGA